MRRRVGRILGYRRPSLTTSVMRDTPGDIQLLASVRHYVMPPPAFLPRR
jgi:hypothetical protein